MKHHDIIVADAGFAGIYASWQLANEGAPVAFTIPNVGWSEAYEDRLQPWFGR